MWMLPIGEVAFCVSHYTLLYVLSEWTLNIHLLTDLPQSAVGTDTMNKAFFREPWICQD
jgi:hypothetical protein